MFLFTPYNDWFILQRHDWMSYIKTEEGRGEEKRAARLIQMTTTAKTQFHGDIRQMSIFIIENKTSKRHQTSKCYWSSVWSGEEETAKGRRRQERWAVKCAFNQEGGESSKIHFWGISFHWLTSLTSRCKHGGISFKLNKLFFNRFCNTRTISTNMFAMKLHYYNDLWPWKN